jgi:hypothetical protein
MDRIDLAQDRYQWRALVITVMNFLAASQQRITSMDLVRLFYTVTGKLEVIFPCISRSVLARFSGSS